MKKTLLASIAFGAAALNAAVTVVPLPNKVVEKGGYCDEKAMTVEVVADATIPAEGYRLTVSPGKATIYRSDDAGEFYARTTLKQLTRDGKIPCVEIEDAPAFKWRGLHFDDCRHFFGKEELKKTINAMAYHKLNVLHWHLTEDQGWRIEIKKYPELVTKGSIRPGSPKPKSLIEPGDDYSGTGWVNNHIPYGPYYYTQDDIREIVEYAARRHVTIVPEIELPGHALAAISAYPEFGCTGEQLEPWWRWGVSEHIFCAGNPKVWQFLEDVLTEVCELFPGPYIHIGGDEAPKTMWKKCPKCQALIKEKGLNGEEGLQGLMTDHFTKFLASKGKRAVGWDEVLDGDPGKETIIMSWRGPQGGIKAANRGNDAVMTPVDPCYLDNPQGLEDDPYEYINYGFIDTLERVYGFDPTAGIDPDRAKHILGGQGNNWTEYTFNGSEYEWKMWPRMSAIAESLWTEKANKDWESFSRRIINIRKDLIKRFQINAATLPDATKK